MHGEAHSWSTRENLAYLSSVAEILVDELATNQPTRKVEKPFEAALACQLNLLNERSSNCKLNVLEDVILEEIQITTLQSESFSTYNRFCWIFRRTVEELQAKRKSNITGNLTVSNGGHLENKAEDWKLIHDKEYSWLIHRMQIWRTTRSSPGTSHESEFCFDNASPEKSCFVDGLVCFISLCLLVFVFLNASRRDRDCPTFASTGKQWIHGIRWDEGSE